jgi:flagellar biosynthetic protein FliR
VSELQALVFARCVGFVLRAPGFSHPAVPAPLRAGFAYVLALAIAAGLSTSVDLPLGTFVLALMSEAALGAALGLAVSMLYDGAYAGGRALDDYVGIRAAVPSAGFVAGAGFGRLWSLAFVTAFFAFGGDRVALGAFAGAFGSLPPGALVRSGDVTALAIGLPATLVRAAFAIAGPALALAFSIQFALAGVARAVPRLSTFALAFPLVFGGVLLATIVTLPLAVPLGAHPWFDFARVRAR